MFKPWIGRSYEDAQFKTLILGESHYGDAHMEHGYDLEEKTILCIQEQIDDVWRSRFYTKIVSTFLGFRPSLADKESFWHSVAYHNLITEPLTGPRKPPSSDQWANSIATLPTILEQLRPDYCVCLGFRMWPHLRGALDFVPLDTSIDAGECGVLFSTRFDCALHGIKHPSGRGYSNDFWHHRITETRNKLMDNKRKLATPSRTESLD